MLTLLALYGGLFLTALVAATLLPAQSELLLGTLLVQSEEPAWALITVATLGNSAGSAVIGDPLTLVAGTLREPLPSFLLLVVLAKLGRYLAVAGVALALW